MQTNHIDKSLEDIKIIFNKVSSYIDNMKSGERIAATKLAKDIGVEFNIPGPTLYPTIHFLLKDYPGIILKNGAKGGILKL
jgi:hypothetical protein